MRIVYLLESVAEPWGGVQTVLRDAQALSARGHQVEVVSRDGPPAWKALSLPFHRDPELSLGDVAPADLVVGTFWTTILPALRSGKGAAVHFCQGLEDGPDLPGRTREAIETVYSMEETELIVVSPHLARVLEQRFGRRSRLVPNTVDSRVMFPGPVREGNRPFRVGLVGPAQFPIKGIATGYEACLLASRAGLDLVLVRASHMPFLDVEFRLPLPLEAHQNLPYERMGEFYRSLDLFLGTSNSENEGFYLPGLEALACGVPSVLTDIPCLRSYGKGDFALFVPPGDREAMAASLLLLARRGDLRRKLREEGLRVARGFTMAARLDLLERTFGEILEEKGSRPTLVPAGPWGSIP